jgi:3-dehydroquinate dehydratase
VQGYRNPVVEKVYKSHNPKVDQPLKEDEETDDYKKMEILKVREDRLKKNEEKIKSIKNIYDHFGKKSEIRTERRHYQS